jgi:hypothetical protein
MKLDKVAKEDNLAIHTYLGNLAYLDKPTQQVWQGKLAHNHLPEYPNRAVLTKLAKQNTLAYLAKS